MKIFKFLFLLFCLLSLHASAPCGHDHNPDTITISWAKNNEADVVGYNVYILPAQNRGQSNDTIQKMVGAELGRKTGTFKLLTREGVILCDDLRYVKKVFHRSSTTLSLNEGVTYYIVVTALSSGGLESDPSEPICYTVPKSIR